MVEYTSAQVIYEELNRQMCLMPERRPYMGLFTNDIKDPNHTGGVEYLPVKLDSLLTRVNNKGTVTGAVGLFHLNYLDETMMRIVARVRFGEQTDTSGERLIRGLRFY